MLILVCDANTNNNTLDNLLKNKANINTNKMLKVDFFWEEWRYATNIAFSRF